MVSVDSKAFSSISAHVGAPRLWRIAALLGAGIFSYGSQVEAQLICDSTTEQASCSAAGVYSFCCVPGFVLADNTADGSASISMTVGQNSLQILQKFTSSGCCVAPYANIGIFDAGARSDQYGKAGSHLPIQLKDIARLQGAWTFQVPMPLNADWQVEQYRVYLEMFLSGTTAGHSDSGNITIDFFWNNFGFDATTGHASINGAQGMDYIDNGNPFGQGPFIDFLYPKGTYAPDSKGVVTVTSTDIKAVLDWAVAKFPDYYNGNLYLTSLSLAEEAGAFHGTVTTSYTSFAIQKAGSDVVFTPAWTSDHWGSGSTGGANSTGTGGSSGSLAGGTSSVTNTGDASRAPSGGGTCSMARQPSRNNFTALLFGLGLVAIGRRKHNKRRTSLARSRRCRF